MDTLHISEISFQDEFTLWVGRIVIALASGAILYIGKKIIEAVLDWIKRINAMIGKFENLSTSILYERDKIVARIAVMDEINKERHVSLKGKVLKQNNYIEEIKLHMHECEKKVTTLFELHNQIHNSNHKCE